MVQGTSSTGSNTLYGIQCDVTNCYYNEQKACAANEIKVGPQFASSSADTVCATFKPR